ncbi:MAG TPA: MYXO-CTERM sorting domain-containing protein [Myxococcota bacterium]|nr:MYXO-CTERM sorting domain-containing protein [Myxococcota bacterium]HRY92544.1 MYXO-CTERM sorting domain-containing protein [Myxococcota bacterium]
MPAACPTGGACEYSPGADGADCAGGLCLAGACVTDQCYIEGAWHLAGEPTSGCTYCDPALARTAWSNRPADYPDDCGTGPCPADGCEGPAWNDYPETCQRTCDGAGACQAACACAPVVTACAAGGCCLAVCDPVAGCASAAGTCADTCTGALLTLGRACSGCGASGADGTCGGGETFACNAGQLCGEQVCGGETAVCTNAGGSFAWRPSPVCDDGDPCTEDDTCSLGVCTGAALACDDQDPCTDDSCDPLGGCGHAYNTAPCDDGDACSMQDSCANGRCSGVPADLDGDGYLASACGGSDCDDGQAAVNPGAFEGPIGSAACQDGLDNDCDGSIDGDARGCRPCQQDADCDDGNACNGADSCEASQCQPGVPLECDDQNPCTADDCSLSTGCTHNPRPGPCDDGDACTAGDVCANGACDGSAVACDDQDPCTDDTCDPQSGCVHASHVGLCDDGDACTENDLCAAGICQGTPKDCSALAAPCIAGVCDPVTGNCEAQALPTSTTCDDGDECTADDHCWSGACQPGRPTCSGGCGCDATGEEAGSGWLLAVGLALLVGLRGRRRVAAT